MFSEQAPVKFFISLLKTLQISKMWIHSQFFFFLNKLPNWHDVSFNISRALDFKRQFYYSFGMSKPLALHWLLQDFECTLLVCVALCSMFYSLERTSLFQRSPASPGGGSTVHYDPILRSWKPYRRIWGAVTCHLWRIHFIGSNIPSGR